LNAGFVRDLAGEEYDRARARELRGHIRLEHIENAQFIPELRGLEFVLLLEPVHPADH
jgi:hypothetical protein